MKRVLIAAALLAPYSHVSLADEPPPLLRGHIGNSIAIGDYAGSEWQYGSYHLAFNFVGVGTYETTMTPEEKAVIYAVLARMLQVRKPDGSPGSRQPLFLSPAAAEPPK